MSDTAPTPATTDPIPPVAPVESAPELSTADQLRELEDKHLGTDAPRVDGAPEKGSGSLFSRLDPIHQAHMLSLRALLDVEAELGKAKAEVEAIEAKVKAAADQVIEAAKKAL